MANKSKVQIGIISNGTERIVQPIMKDSIKPSRVEGLEDTMQSVKGINECITEINAEIYSIKRNDRRRNWTNPRRYRSSGNARKA